jgi:hypothetical protein
MQVKFGAIVTNGSGKIGGQFISSDRNGSSLRTKNFKAKNSQVNTISQRGIVSLMSRAWRELTEAQRQLWQSYAATLSLKNNGYGGAYLSGFQTFMQVNCSFYVDGDSIVTTPSFNLDALPVQIVSFGLGSLPVVPSRFAPIGGGLFVCLVPENDPLFDPSTPKALVCADNYITSSSVYQRNPLSSIYANGTYIGSSVNNTEIMANAGLSLFPLALFCIAYGGGGFSDWCFPSRDAALAIANGGKPSFLNPYDLIFSSTEVDSSNADVISLNANNYSSYGKNFTYPTVPVRFCSVPVSSGLVINLSSDLLSNIKVKVSVTKPVSIGISNPRNTFTDLGIFDSSSASKVDITAAYEAKFGSLSGLSGKIFIKAFVFDSVTKQRSNAFISSTTLS